MKKKILNILSVALSFFAGQQVYSQIANATITNSSKLTISRHVYGHFAEHLGRCIYDGFWVDPKMPVPKQDRIRLDVVEALKKIKIPNLRWPGGCFADEYHWRDGIGPRNRRSKMVNTNWGGVTEDNSFGTHEFLELCELLGCEPYITGNVGSGTIEEMNKWVEYLNFGGESPMADLRTQNGHPKPYKVKFWGVGNENWGCGGNMTAEYYTNEYKRYSTYVKNYPNAPLMKIAGGPVNGHYAWTESLMKSAAKLMWGLSLHYYTSSGPWQDKRSATDFTEVEYITTMKNCLKMDEYITKHSAIMDKYDPEKKVALVVDEWGIWSRSEPHTILYQQNSMRDALVAATTLNIFNNHCERVKMANLAQTINVLQALILTDKEKMILTPTYHVFDLYKVHQDARFLPLKLESPDYALDTLKVPAINISASQDTLGRIHITLVNVDNSKDIDVSIDLGDLKWGTVSGEIITSPRVTDINTFEKPGNIKIVPFNKTRKNGSQVLAKVPAHSVVMLELN